MEQGSTIIKSFIEIPCVCNDGSISLNCNCRIWQIANCLNVKHQLKFLTHNKIIFCESFIIKTFLNLLKNILKFILIF